MIHCLTELFILFSKNCKNKIWASRFLNKNQIILSTFIGLSLPSEILKNSQSQATWNLNSILHPLNQQQWRHRGVVVNSVTCVTLKGVLNQALICYELNSQVTLTPSQTHRLGCVTRSLLGRRTTERTEVLEMLTEKPCGFRDKGDEAAVAGSSPSCLCQGARHGLTDPPLPNKTSSRAGSALKDQTVSIWDLGVKTPNWGYYAGTYITRERTNFHTYFIDEIQNIVILSYNCCNTGLLRRMELGGMTFARLRSLSSKLQMFIC